MVESFAICLKTPRRLHELFTLMCQRSSVDFPILAVKFDDFDFLRMGFQAAQIYIDAVGVRAWNVKRFDATNTAEFMFGHAGIERVSN